MNRKEQVFIKYKDKWNAQFVSGGKEFDFRGCFYYIDNNLIDNMAELKGKLLKIYKQTAKQWELKKNGSLNTLSDVILFFANHDPSGTYKFVQVMINILMNENKTKETIADLIQRFAAIEHKLSPKIFENADPALRVELPLSILNNPKDIQSYRTYKNFQIVITIAQKYSTKRDQKNQIIEETTILYDKDDYTVVVPLTFEASCFWGVDTKWCTTSRDNPKYFYDYSNNGTLVYVIDKYRQHEKDHPMSKLAVYIRHENTEHDGEIFNRFDTLMGRGLNRVLPEYLIRVIMEYHIEEEIVNLLDLLQLFVEYKQTVSTLPLDDEWKQGKSPSDNMMAFFCEQFPSYICLVKFDFNVHTKEGEMSLGWFYRSEHGEKMVFTHPTQTVRSKNLLLHAKNHILPKLWNSMLFNIVDKSNTYIIAKQKILDHIISSYFNRPISGWQFKTVHHKWSRNIGVFSEEPPSLTDLGTHIYQIHGNYADLQNYTVTAALSFTVNSFILYGGKTDEILWDDQYQDFNLLYYTESGLINLMNDFTSWVIQTITSQSEKIINDLYEDAKLTITSKSTAFDEYLKCPDDVNKQSKPSGKSR